MARTVTSVYPTDDLQGKTGLSLPGPPERCLALAYDDMASEAGVGFRVVRLRPMGYAAAVFILG